MQQHQICRQKCLSLEAHGLGLATQGLGLNLDLET